MMETLALNGLKKKEICIFHSFDLTNSAANIKFENINESV